MTGRRRFLPYLTLTLVIVGAIAHGFLSRTAAQMRWAATGVSEGAGFDDRGTLPTFRGARQNPDARKTRSTQDGDSSLVLTSTVAAVLPGAPADFIEPDLGRYAATVRHDNRPRDPPASI